jgi:hypothetical protein
MFVRYPPGKVRYEDGRPIALLGVGVAASPLCPVDLPLGLPTTLARTRRGTWALYPIGPVVVVVVHPGGAVSGPPAEVAAEVGRLAARDRQGELDRQAAKTIQQLLTATAPTMPDPDGGGPEPGPSRPRPTGSAARTTTTGNPPLGRQTTPRRATALTAGLAVPPFMPRRRRPSQRAGSPAGASAAGDAAFPATGTAHSRDSVELATVNAVPVAAPSTRFSSGEVPGRGSAASVFRYPTRILKSLPTLRPADWATAMVRRQCWRPAAWMTQDPARAVMTAALTWR